MSSRALCIVEDDKSLRRLELLVLSGLPSLDVHAFEYAEEALAALESIRPALLIVDLTLPGMSGAEFIHRAREVLPYVPVIVTTAERERFADQLRGLRGVEIWDKPYAIQDLREKVHEVLRSTAGEHRGGGEGPTGGPDS